MLRSRTLAATAREEELVHFDRDKFPVFTWSDTHHAAKDLAEVTLVNESRARTGFENRRLRVKQESLGLLNATARMAAVRRLAYEAADSGLLSPELTAGIHRVNGVRKLGSRLGNWLTASEASAFWQSPDGRTLTGKRNRAMPAILLGCGRRRRELAELTVESLQRREERWAIVDLVGKGRHVRTVPVPNW